MDDLGEVKENFVEFFRCIEKPATPIKPYPPPPPASHANLLASSSRYGYLFVACGTEVLSYALADLRTGKRSATPTARVDLAAQNVSAIFSVALLLEDTVLVVHATNESSGSDTLLLLSVPALARGTATLLPSPPLGGAAQSVAVRPTAVPEAHAPPDSQYVVIMLRKGAVEVHQVSPDGVWSPAMQVDSARLSADGPTCIALSPGDELLAVGTRRGCVALYDAESASLRATIVEVESGWVPFAVHFAAADAVLVSYACADMVSHVVWTIGEEGGDLGVVGHSPLGELCFASPPSLPPSEDSDAGDVKGADADAAPPFISCCPVPGWEACIVASSHSTDVEVIALNEDGVWENWTFDEGRSATLPTDEDDTDTKPIGVAFDLTDTAPIESADPSVPGINPMPRLITFTSAFLLLPFVLIDDRPEVRYEHIREPASLPPAPTVNRSVEGTVFSDGSTVANALALQGVQTTPPSSPAVTLEQARPTGGRTDLAVPANADIDESHPAPRGRRVLFGSSQNQGFSSLAAIEDSPFKASVANTAAFGKMRERDESESSQESATEEEDGGTPPGSATHMSSAFQVPGETFSGTEGFLSNFRFPTISETQRADTKSQPFSAILGPAQNVRNRDGEAALRTQRDVPKSTTVSSVSLPPYPPQPSLNEAAAAAESGKPLDLVKSVLLEMVEELNYSTDAAQVTKRRLQARDEEIQPTVDKVRADLAKALEAMRKRFQDESSLRNEVLGSLKKVMSLSREYETMALDFRIREQEGLSSSLQPEDKAIDEQLSKKEAEVLKSISSIEERLNEGRTLRERRINPTEQLQQIYSSLSLQGIRIRRVCGLLTALSERIDELDVGGRRTDLGLSMARLEKLSIAQNDTGGIVGGKGKGRIDVAEEEVNRHDYDFPYNADETSVASQDVRKVLRRLAMRGGRANICVKRLQKSHSEHSELQARNGGFAAQRNVVGDTAEQSYQGTDTTAFASAEPLKRPTQAENVDETSRPSFRKENKSMIAGQADLPPAPDVSSVGIAITGDSRAITALSGSKSIFGGPVSLPTVGEGWTTTSNAASSSDGKRSRLDEFERSVSLQPKPTATRTSVVAALPPDASAFGSLRSVVPKPPKERSSQFASLPPDESPSGNAMASAILPNKQFAALPPDEPIVSQTEAAGKPVSVPFASLPPETDVSTIEDKRPKPTSTSGLFAALPPDPLTSKGVETKTPGEEGESKDKNSGLESAAVIGTLLKASEGSKKRIDRTLFAALPPDDDVQGSDMLKRERKSPAVDNASSSEKLATDVHGASAKPEGESTTKEPSLSASKGDAAIAVNDRGAPSGAITSRDAQSKPREIGEVGSLFGAAASLNVSSSSSSLFGSAALSRVAESTPVAEKVPVLQGSSSDDSDGNGNGGFESSFGMDTTTTSAEADSMFGAALGAPGSQQSFGVFGDQALGSSGQTTSGAGPFGQSAATLFGDAGSKSQPFGTASMQDSQTGGFGGSVTQSTGHSPFVSLGGGSSSAFPSSTASFGAASPYGAAAQFGAPAQLGSQFGATSQLGGGFVGTAQVGGGSQFGATSQLGAGFGATSQLGGGSPFAAHGGGMAAAFGGGTPAPKFGESSFGMSQGSGQQSSFGNSSPFGSVSGAGFGGQTGGGSGFAALAAAPQPFGPGGSGFGNAGAPAFGTNNGPPSFTSAAFAQRRA